MEMGRRPSGQEEHQTEVVVVEDDEDGVVDAEEDGVRHIHCP